jgi:multidrug resistance protein MdtO
MVTGLSTIGVMKQRLTFRLLGAIIGGLSFGLGATAFLFPHMDSISSFVALVGFVAFFSSWLLFYDLRSIWQCPRSCRLLQNLITLP